MKINFITPSVSRMGGGLLTSVRSLANELNCFKEVDISVLALDDDFTTSDLTSWAPLEPFIFPVRGPHAFGYGLGMREALVNSNADIFHNHGLWRYSSFLVNRHAEKKHKPYLVTPHGMLDSWALTNSSWKKKFAGSLYEKRNLRAASCIHSLCGAETNSIRSYGIESPVCQIPNGVDLPSLDQLYLEPPWANSVPEGKKVVLYLGRINQKKGLKNLIKAWKNIQEAKTVAASEWALVIAGWDESEHELELMGQVNELGLKNEIFFIGPQFNKSKASCYYFADAFVLPSMSEGLPMAVLEAWSYKLPVIMTTQCNLPEGFIAGAAIKIETIPEDIGRGLLNLLEMSEMERSEMGSRGFSLVKDRFTWDKVAVDMKLVYQWLLGGGNPPPCVLEL